MIYKARKLHSYLTHLTLAGIDNGVLEWIGTDLQWYNAELNSLSKAELLNAQETAESDYYDLTHN